MNILWLYSWILAKEGISHNDDKNQIYLSLYYRISTPATNWYDRFNIWKIKDVDWIFTIKMILVFLFFYLSDSTYLARFKICTC